MKAQPKLIISEDELLRDFRLPLSSLAYWNPFNNVIWDGINTSLKKTEVAEAIQNRRFRDKPMPDFSFRDPPASRAEHAARVAYLVTYGWLDAISLDVGVPDLGCYVSWIVVDGNHRLAAAFYAEDETILVGVSGARKTICERLNLQCRK